MTNNSHRNKHKGGFNQPLLNVSPNSAHSLPLLLISICSPLLSLSVRSSPPASRLVLPPCRAVVSLQPPQSSPHREGWRRSKPGPLSPGWATSSPGPQASLQACGPESWQLREAIVEARLTTHGSHCAKQKHMHTHLYWDIQSHAFPQHGFYCLPTNEDVKCCPADVTSQWIVFHKVSVCGHCCGDTHAVPSDYSCSRYFLFIGFSQIHT